MLRHRPPVHARGKLWTPCFRGAMIFYALRAGDADAGSQHSVRERKCLVSAPAERSRSAAEFAGEGFASPVTRWLALRSKLAARSSNSLRAPGNRQWRAKVRRPYAKCRKCAPPGGEVLSGGFIGRVLSGCCSRRPRTP
jgi:hypothetical protein